MSQREPLTRERIIETALHLIDGQGLGRLTMRRLGDSLRVEAMAIYHHLPHGKEQLLEQLIAHVAALPVPPGDGEPRERLRSWAHAYRSRLLEHVGVMPLIVTRRSPGALVTTTLSVRELLRESGLPEAEASVGAHVLLGYLLGTVALEARERASGTTIDEVDWDQRFTAGLDRVLTGLA
ncbi:TetR/AcrR family transcriptional regulator [Actinoallomurus spadix]|uniref:TetR family transcriptional regulator n=1 Tax=Actinoallomurus spadix TaxID=79912 RepID=A0ABN0WN70_9ACTN|nr:TetR/AcrR family transcriptional regulator [Actinoallomurus spadix]MCO5984681.1 TetR/AcrR family transcriptional regulator [Actinoallomurus spadix]